MDREAYIVRKHVLVLMGCVWLLAGCATTQGPVPASQPVVLDTGWEYRWGDSPLDDRGVPVWTFSSLDSLEWKPTRQPLDLPGSDSHHILWLRIKLPQVQAEEPTVFIPRAYLQFQAYLGSRPVYSFGDFEPEADDRFRSFVSHSIPLPSDFGEKTLFLRLYSDVPGIDGIEGKALLGSRVDLLPSLIKMDLFQALVGIFCVFFGLAALVVCLDPGARPAYAALSFGLFAIFIGLSFLARVVVLTWIWEAPAFWYYVLFTSFILFPAALIAFVAQVIGPGYRLFLRRLWQFHLLFAAMVIVLDVTGLRLIPQWTDLLRFLWILDTVSVLGTSVYAAIRGKFEARMMMIGIVFFSIFALNDIFNALVGVWLMPLGTFLFILTLGYILYYRFTENNRRLRVYSEELERNSRLLEQAKAELEEYSRTLEQKVEQRTREVREKHAQLVQAGKMAALGSLVAGVAHEINTPMGAIHSMHNTLVRAIEKLKTELKGCLEEGREQPPGLSASIRAVDEANAVIASGSERVIAIVRRLRSFARLDEAEIKDADIHEGLEDTLAMIHHEIKHHVTVRKHFGDLPRVSCYPGRLNQVFLNLLINAAQAIEGEGEINITTSHENGWVRIEIADTGRGIPPENLDRIFDPGFTTKGAGIGTGLGLSICYQIVQDHVGEIRVRSELGKGSTFTVLLPTDLEKRLEQREP
jgi:signal transduction histidine kinase